MPAVAVIIATYNHAGYLAQAVESVLAQSWPDWELAIVDDGSTDGTAEVLAKLSAAHPGRFRAVRQANAGVGSAMNRGLAETTGPLVAFLDSDDTWTPDHLATLAPMLQADGAAVVAFGRRDVMDAAGRLIDRPGKPYHSGRVTTELFRSMFISKICLLARRRAVEQAGGFDTALRMGEDYELLLRLSRLGNFLGAERIVAHRRRHGRNITADSPAYRVRVAALLERFYFKLQGYRDVDPAVGRARLADVHYAAGKKLLLAGDGRASRFHLARSAVFARMLKGQLLRWMALPALAACRRQVSPALPAGYEFLPSEQLEKVLGQSA